MEVTFLVCSQVLWTEHAAVTSRCLSAYSTWCGGTPERQGLPQGDHDALATSRHPAEVRVPGRRRQGRHLVTESQGVDK